MSKNFKNTPSIVSWVGLDEMHVKVHKRDVIVFVSTLRFVSGE